MVACCARRRRRLRRYGTDRPHLAKYLAKEYSATEIELERPEREPILEREAEWLPEEALDSAFATLKKGKAVGLDDLSKEIIHIIADERSVTQ